MMTAAAVETLTGVEKFIFYDPFDARARGREKPGDGDEVSVDGTWTAREGRVGCA